MPRPKLLILGGTREAAQIACGLAERHGESLSLVTSWAGRTEGNSGDLGQGIAGDFRHGGFGGSDGLARYLREAKIDRLIDATHPFARRISANARLACEAEGIPRLQVHRQGWGEKMGHPGIELDSLKSAAERVGTFGRRAFLTTGRSGLDAFRQVDGVHFVVRLLADPGRSLPLKTYTLIIGRPPFTREEERALMRERHIQVLVTKDSGGADTEAKIFAAHDLGLPVLYIRRPPPEPGDCVSSVAEALAWVSQRLGGGRER